MENEQFDNLTIKIAQKLQIDTNDLILKNMRPEEDTSDLLNIVLSSHISSLSNCMLELSKPHEKMHAMVKNFLVNLMSRIKEIKPINEVDIIKVKK